MAGRCPVLIVAGQDGGDARVPAGAELISLARHFTLKEALASPLDLVSEVVASCLRSARAVGTAEPLHSDP